MHLEPAKQVPIVLKQNKLAHSTPLGLKEIYEWVLVDINGIRSYSTIRIWIRGLMGLAIIPPADVLICQYHLYYITKYQLPPALQSKHHCKLASRPTVHPCSESGRPSVLRRTVLRPSVLRPTVQPSYVLLSFVVLSSVMASYTRITCYYSKYTCYVW